MAHVLFVSADSGSIVEQVLGALRASHQVDIARSAEDGFTRLVTNPPDVVVLDFCLPDRAGFEVLEAIRKTDPHIPIIFLAPSAAAADAIEVIKRGAIDYLFKPVVPAQLQQIVKEVTETAGRWREPVSDAHLRADGDIAGPIIGACSAMRGVYKAIGRVAGQDVPVLITGESGTGKELVARAVHQHSRRADQPFVALNCAAIPESLLESELFGHEKGSFTGADRRRVGRFEQCNGGTLFLDEIGDMPLALQAKMLRVLQDQTFERIGGGTVRTDVRIISATHRDLKARSAEGTFRADLYYRLSVFAIHLPPLRERVDDVPLLVRHFLRQFGQELGREVRDISPGALARLQGYTWPGNLRELQSVLKQALLQTTGPVLLPHVLPDLENPVGEPDSEQLSGDGLNQFVRRRINDGSKNLLDEVHQELERELLPLVMDLTRGNQRQAAQILGIARLTLRRRLRTLNIEPQFASVR